MGNDITEPAQCKAARHCWRARRVLVALLAALCGGCVAYQPLPLQPRQSAAEFGARRLDAVALQAQVAPLLPAASSWPPRDWDRGVLLAVALVQNRELAVARAQLQQAQAHEIGAGEAPNPDLTLQSEYARHDPHPWLYGIGIALVVPYGERRALQRDAARLASDSARWSLLEQAWNLRRILVAALNDWQLAQRRLPLLRQLGEAEDRLVELAQVRVAAGEDAPAELLTERQAQLQTAQLLAQAQADAATAQAACAAALGLPPTALDGFAPSWPEWGEPPSTDAAQLQQLRENALLSRADLAASLSDYSASETRLKLAVAQQYPQLQVSPGYYWDHGIAKFPLDVNFALPFNGNRGEIAEARAARELAAQRMLALQAQIYDQVEAAQRAEGLAQRNAAAAERSVLGAAEQQRQSELGLRLGANGRHEQLAAQLVALHAQLDALQLRAAWQEARDRLEDALHAPLSGPELALVPNLPTLADGGTP